MNNYPIGTLVRVNKLDTNQGTIDVREENIIGYITDSWKAEYTYYIVYLFIDGKKHRLYEWYLEPV